MRIALDYDGTYTKAPDFWDKFIRDCASHGHTIICVTMRYPTEPVQMICPVVYTSREAKARHTMMNGIEFDIWIDDNPLWIYQNA